MYICKNILVLKSAFVYAICKANTLTILSRLTGHQSMIDDWLQVNLPANYPKLFPMHIFV